MQTTWPVATAELGPWIQAQGLSGSEPLLAQGSEPGHWSCAGVPMVFTVRLPAGK
ncbi:hypothetical protein [Synechococcus sp. 1G10]|uniref:hypothetical protein n=1 Tax=Synechococcus sp. 1G10 TaxID=2025605 RepID=UPI0013032F2E|nr:hypothetical protein [Synechococcus sp. 1G10]